MNKARNTRDSFTEDYSLYFPMVLNTIYTKVSDRDIAEDLCQEVFIALYNKYNEIENIRKWLNGTIRNVVMKYYRDKKPGVDIDDVFYDITLTFVNGFRDARITITEAIEAVVKDENDKILVEMIAYHNYSYEHVSKMMGITRRKVVYRYGRIIEEITDFLKKRGIQNLEDLL
jgi:RNA polymerase sigma factor (sigma-70 family)